MQTVAMVSAMVAAEEAVENDVECFPAVMTAMRRRLRLRRQRMTFTDCVSRSGLRALRVSLPEVCILGNGRFVNDKKQNDHLYESEDVY